MTNHKKEFNTKLFTQWNHSVDYLVFVPVHDAAGQLGVEICWRLYFRCL
jgi:hypothetical protein